MVMELVEGETLGQFVSKNGKLEERVATNIVLQLLGAVSDLHAEDILHRDIKPNNIVIQESGQGIRAVLLDLGIVMLTREQSMTMQSSFLGSKRWAPYEQLMGEKTDFKSDLYSIAAVFYYMVSGNEPYQDKGTEASIAMEMIKNALSIPRDGMREGGRFLDELDRCLNRNSSLRPDSAISLLDFHKQNNVNLYDERSVGINGDSGSLDLRMMNDRHTADESFFESNKGRHLREIIKDMSHRGLPKGIALQFLTENGINIKMANEILSRYKFNKTL